MTINHNQRNVLRNRKVSVLLNINLSPRVMNQLGAVDRSIFQMNSLDSENGKLILAKRLFWNTNVLKNPSVFRNLQKRKKEK